MQKNDKMIAILGVVILVLASVGIYYYEPVYDQETISSVEEMLSIKSTYSDDLNAITVSDSNPFYALIATPLAVHYDEDCKQYVKPLYVKDLNTPSDAITRAEGEIGIFSDFCISDEASLGNSIKEISLGVASKFWESSDAVLLIEDSEEGYNLGVVATPIASYLGIPVIVTDKIDGDVNKVLDDLGVNYHFICGDLESYGASLVFEDVDEIVDTCVDLLKQKFGKVDYITLANPLDINTAEVLDQVKYDTIKGSVVTTSFTASGIMGIIGGMLKGIPMTGFHEFEIPEDYKYAKIKIVAKNLVDENVDETGSQLQPMLYDPDGNLLAFLFTVGGIPERDSNGKITEDKIEFETIIYDNPGTYSLMVSGKYLTKKYADYEIDVTVEKLASSIEPNMPKLSSMAPYLTAYHQGIVFAKPEFVYVADESISDDLSPGVAFPASNPDLIADVNKHIYEKIHTPLNELLVKISNMSLDLDDEDDLKQLRDYYDESPIYVAIVSDDRMVPQYYYYDTPDASTLQYGWDVASDFIYGNIDPVPRDDKISIHPRDRFLVDKYDEKYPYQENIVGRITGWDVQDASALVARSVFYQELVKNSYCCEWKDNALVQTGSGTDFQRIPIVDTWRKIVGGIFGMHDLAMKWPTGEAHAENVLVASALESGKFSIRQTENTESMRQPVSEDVLNDINRMGILNVLLFPKVRAAQITGESSLLYDIHGEEDLENSNFIFTFGHGQPMGYQHGDVQTDSIGFRPVLLQNLLNRISIMIPSLAGTVLSSGLGNAGGYYTRFVENMELGPSVMFVESCYIGRIDGFPAKCCVSQAYMHAGLNALIASSRGSPGPGYLDTRSRPVGFGLSDYLKANRNIEENQDPHFSSLFAIDTFDSLIDDNTDVGTAFRNARNNFMEDAGSEFFWTPPLSLDIQSQQDLSLYQDSIKLTSDTGDMTCMEKKYTCQLEYNLFGDPAFNPYEPVNEGKK